jgi:DNA recombination protein RmuC
VIDSFETGGLLVAGIVVAAVALLLVTAAAIASAQRSALLRLAAQVEQTDRRVREDGESLRRAMTGLDRALRWEIAEATREALAQAFVQVQDATAATVALREAIGERLGELGEKLGEEQDRLRGRVEAKLEEIRANNDAKLEQMRRAVDEQLQTALEKRVGESFQRVADQFAQVQQAIGQVQGLAGEIGGIRRLFANVKARGGWGEAQLRQLLDDVLPPGAYEANLRVGDAGEVVEFALRMPLRESQVPVWLPIDAKFPAEDYDRLIIAIEAGDRAGEAEARRGLERAIREQAKRIARYVRPPRTVDHAVMYLPTEGLFAEAARLPGLLEGVRREHGVHVVGPALLPALLQMIRLGHLTLALEQKAGAIGETLGAVKSEWGLLGGALDQLARKAEEMSNTIQRTQVRSRAVGRALRGVGVMEFERAEAVLGLVEKKEGQGSALDPGTLRTLGNGG